MRDSRHIGIRRNKLKGGAISNIKKLEDEFMNKISFGKAPPPDSAEKIKKKFSI